MVENESDVHPTLSVYLSRDDFRQALDYAVEERRLSLREAIIVRRARRNPRVFDRLYDRICAECPVEVYAYGFDPSAFLDWLIENLPTILQILATLLMFI